MPYVNQYGYPNGYNPYQTNQPYNSGTFIHVKSENEAREWPLTLGQSAIFINDNEPYIYTKSMGLSPLDPYSFKVFSIIEKTQSTPISTQTSSGYLTKEDLEPIKAQIDNMTGYLTKEDFEPFKNSLNDVCRRLDKLKELTG